MKCLSKVLVYGTSAIVDDKKGVHVATTICVEASNDNNRESEVLTHEHTLIIYETYL